MLDTGVTVQAMLDNGVRLASADGLLYLLTPCCQASAKGSANSPTGVVCRACYMPIPAWMGWGVSVVNAESAVESVTDLLREHGGVLKQLLGTIPMTVVLEARRQAGMQ